MKKNRPRIKSRVVVASSDKTRINRRVIVKDVKYVYPSFT